MCIQQKCDTTKWIDRTNNYIMLSTEDFLPLKVHVVIRPTPCGVSRMFFLISVTIIFLSVFAIETTRTQWQELHPTIEDGM